MKEITNKETDTTPTKEQLLAMFSGMTEEESLQHQLKYWVDGISLHNPIREECCPDFSCCGSDIMPSSMRQEFATAHKNGDTKTVYKFLSMALSGLYTKTLADIYINKGERHEDNRSRDNNR